MDLNADIKFSTDPIFNKISKLENSKWTSLKKLNGWKHYEVININKKNNQIELLLFVCHPVKCLVDLIATMK